MFVAYGKIKPHPKGNVRDLIGEPLDHSQQLLHFCALTKMSFMTMFISELKMQKSKLTYMNLVALMALTGYLMIEKHWTEEIDTAEFPNPNIVREFSQSTEVNLSSNVTRFVFIPFCFHLKAYVKMPCLVFEELEWFISFVSIQILAL